MSWLRLQLRLLRRDLRGAGVLSAVLVTVALVRPEWGESLARPARWLFIAVVFHGALRWGRVVGKVGALAAVAPVRRGWIEAVGLGVWLGVSAMLAVSFAVMGSWDTSTGVAALWLWLLAASAGLGFTGSWGAAIPAVALVLPLVRGGPISLTLGSYPTSVCVGVSAAVLLFLGARWLRRTKRQELLPEPTPKTVRPMKTHAERGSREQPRSPGASLRLFFDPLADDPMWSAHGGRMRFLWRLLTDAVLLVVLAQAISHPAAGLLLGMLGLSLALQAVGGMRALRGWPVPGWRVVGLLAWRPVLWFAVGFLVLSSQWHDRAVTIVHRVGLEADPELRAALARMPDAPSSLPASWTDEDGEPPARPSHWPLRWTGKQDRGLWLDLHYWDAVGRKSGRPYVRTAASPFDRRHRPLFDERAEYGEIVAFYLKGRFGITRTPEALAADLGRGYDLDAVLDLGAPQPQNREALDLAAEISIPLYPWNMVTERVRDPRSGRLADRTHFERVEDLAPLRKRWSEGKKDGRVYAFGPALRRLEMEIQPDIRRIAWEHRGIWVLLLLIAFVLGLRAGVASRSGVVLFLAAAALLPATWILMRWQPLGIELVASAHRHSLLVGVALVLVLIAFVRGLVRAWTRRVLEPGEAR